MKNFNTNNRHNSHGHHGSKRRELAQHTLTWIAHIDSHTFINTATTTLCEVPAQLLRNLESLFFIWRYLREGEQTGVPGENHRQPVR